MPLHRGRLAWLVAVGLSQAGLAAVALWLVTLPTETGMSFGVSSSFTSRSRAVYFTGYPVPWLERHHEYAYSSVLSEPTVVWRGPEEWDGWNPIIPPVVFLAAVSLPPIAFMLAAHLARRFCSRAGSVLLSRAHRLWGVVWLASVAAMCVAWLEAETAEFQATRTPWSAHEPSHWIAEAGVSQDGIRHARQGRRWLDQRLLGGFVSPDWTSRTRLTLVVFLFCGVAGCLVFRPWRRAASKDRSA